MADLAGQILNPLNAANFALSRASRIEALPEMLRRQAFGDATFRTLRERAPMRAPLLLLNSADMRTGLRFTFTQEQLDRLCLDLRDIPLADAVAASAAFPVALTPLPLPVHSPCRAQTEERRLEPAGIVAGFERRARLREALAASRQGCGAPPSAERHVLFGATAHDQPDLSNALRQWHYLNRDACGRELPERRRLRFVHLQDGGTADNLALGAPLEAATGGEAGSMLGQAIRDGRVREIIFVGVNARSQGHGPGRDGGTPGVPAMLLASINTPIDSRSGGLAAQLHALEPVLNARYPHSQLRVHTLRVDFELIADAECRAAFQSIATSWTLPPHEVVALQEMASAMLRSNPKYLAFTSGPRDPRVGLARARAACDRMREHSGAPPTFGG
jgi:NTE family protein